MAAKPTTDDDLPAIDRLKTSGPETEMLRPLSGTFAVENRLWPEPGADPIISVAVAHRRLVDDMYLEEVMTPTADADQPAFTRVSYLCFSVLNRRWEYVSLDTRIPAQLMYELSADDKVGDGQTLILNLPGFTLPGWGSDVTGQWARQRREITLESPDRQIMRQYWTLPAAPEEYLAVSYVYSREE
jgi:hypothetical protein